MLRTCKLGDGLGNRALRAWIPCCFHEAQSLKGLSSATDGLGRSLFAQTRYNCSGSVDQLFDEVVVYDGAAPDLVDSLADSVTASTAVMHSAAEAGAGFEPVTGAVQLIAGLQGATGLPWWAAISLTAVGVRCAMVPLSWQQMRATAANAPLLRQAMASVSESDQKGNGRVGEMIARFRSLRQQHRTPHPSWIIAAPLAQLPVFVTAVMAVRRMAGGSWPGFEAGGLFWFQDLTQPALQLDVVAAPLGSAGIVLPMAVGGLMLANLHIAFGRGPAGQKGSVSGWAASTARLGLEWLTLPLFVIALQLPQAALVYWTSSASMALAQSLVLRLASVRQLLGQPTQGVPGASPVAQIEVASNKELSEAISQVQDVQQLFVQAAELRAEGKRPAAILVLQRITQLDPDNARAWFALGQTFGSLKAWPQAEQAYRRAAHLEDDRSQEARCWFGAGVAIHQQGGRLRAAFDAFGEAASLALGDADPPGRGLAFAFTAGRLDRVPGPTALPVAVVGTGVLALMSQATILYSKGQFAETVLLLQRAAGFDPSMRRFLDKEIAGLQGRDDERTEEPW